MSDPLCLSKDWIFVIQDQGQVGVFRFRKKNKSSMIEAPGLHLRVEELKAILAYDVGLWTYLFT